MSQLRDSMEAWARDHGYRVAFDRPEVLDVVRADIEERRRREEFDRVFFDSAIATLPLLGPAELEGMKTLLLVSVPRPAHRLTFQTADGPFEAIVPPTYREYPTAMRTREQLLAGPLAGYRLTRVGSPIKGAAARLGLARYGRNNITYVPGFGSYHQLVGLLTDADLGVDTAGGRASGDPAEVPLMAEECEGCWACRAACPTGAIGDDRFLLHTERCVTFWNESDWSWPDWMSPTAHNCIVGCLACQEACPQNAGRLRCEPLGPAFTAEETGWVLAGPPKDGDGGRDGGAVATASAAQWAAIVAKLTELGLNGYETIVTRNLSALMEARRAG
ncbi:MAG TPA: 4Fe-4S double cluster binding domain-containing protein [Bacillota bacterium]|jgi:epoxyqueuosine reductase